MVRAALLDRLLALRLTRPWSRYGAAVACTALALLIRGAMQPFWGEKFLLLMCYPAVVAGAWLGGVGPGVVGTVACAAGVEYLWVPFAGFFSMETWANLLGPLAFVVLGVVTTLVNEALRAAHDRSTRANLALEAATAEAREHAKEDEEARALLDVLLTHVPAGIMIAHGPPDFPVRATSAYADASLRRTRNAIVGHPAGVLIEGAMVLLPDGTRVATEKLPLYRAAHGDTIVDQDLIVVAGDGTRRWITVHAAPIRSSAGEVVGAVACWNDMTERKQAEEALRHAEAALREADRRKDVFLATLSHELSNPLGAIRTASAILRRPGLDDTAAQHAAAVIDRQAEQLARLAGDLLDVSRGVTGKMRLRRGALDLRETVQRCVEACHETNGANHVLTFAGEPAWVDGDGLRIEQVVSNLLSNAVRYTPAGRRIAVTVGSTDGSATIDVEDEGRGIPSEVLPRIFEMFVQGDAGTEGGRAGLGIGLALVRQLVELHGGTVEARSDGPGKGSRFTVRLPALSPPRS